MSEQTFGSKWEENVYRALVLLKLEFLYQVPMYYGRTRRGGTVIDFVVQQPPNQIALFVDGPYWHRTAARRMDDDLIRRELESDGYEVMVIEEESETLEGSIAWVKMNIL